MPKDAEIAMARTPATPSVADNPRTSTDVRDALARVPHAAFSVFIRRMHEEVFSIQ